MTRYFYLILKFKNYYRYSRTYKSKKPLNKESLREFVKMLINCDHDLKDLNSKYWLSSFEIVNIFIDYFSNFIKSNDYKYKKHKKSIRTNRI